MYIFMIGLAGEVKQEADKVESKLQMNINFHFQDKIVWSNHRVVKDQRNKLR